MRINRISNNYGKPMFKNQSQNGANKTTPINENSLQADTVSFNGAHNIKTTVIERMTTCAVDLLHNNNFKTGQEIYIKADASFLPFMEVLSKEAYKIGSGLVIFNVIEPEIEELKHKYNISEEFDYKKLQLEQLQNNNALFLEFNKENNPYNKANISLDEIQAEIAKSVAIIPEEIRQLFKADPKEIIKDAMDIHKGQPVFIKGEREHLPLIVKLADYLYGENETKLISISIANKNANNFLKHADDKLLEYVPKYDIEMYKEFYEKDVAWLQLEGSDPNEFAGIDASRIIKHRQARSLAIEEYANKTTSNVPWLVYYAPTTKSVKTVYTEFGDDSLKALEQAYNDANKINRMGKLDEHVNALDYRANKMNELMKKGYRTLHYVSVDADTKTPDGKTDFKITMSPKSIFNSARCDMPKYGHKPLVNIPTEEVFTAPQADTAQGVVSATMPLSLNGQIIEGIRLTFNKGQVVEIHADKNEDMLKAYILENKNADRLGEVALVAGSPIASMGRLFNSTLLDENASCHLALGNAYSDCIEGAEDFENYQKLKDYLKNLNINSSPTHTDFMIGGENVYISAINDETGDVIEIIKDDKFLL